MDDRNFILLIGTFISVIWLTSKFVTKYFSTEIKENIIKKPGEQYHISIFTAWLINNIGIVDVVMFIYLFYTYFRDVKSKDGIHNDIGISVFSGVIVSIIFLILLTLFFLFIAILVMPTINVGAIFNYILKEFIYQLKNQELRGQNKKIYEKEKRICNIGIILTGIGSAIFTICFGYQMYIVYHGGKDELLIVSFIGITIYMATYCVWKSIKSVIKDLEEYRLFYLFDKDNKLVVVTSLYIEVEDKYMFYKNGIRCSYLKSEIKTIFCEEKLKNDISNENKYSIKFKKLYNWIEKFGETKLIRKFKETDFFKIITK